MVTGNIGIGRNVNFCNHIVLLDQLHIFLEIKWTIIAISIVRFFHVGTHRRISCFADTIFNKADNDII